MYKLTGYGVRRLEDSADIPAIDGNADYERYKQWLEEGNTPQPRDADPWLPAATADLTARTDAMQASITTLQTDYLTAGDQVNAAACRDLKAQFNAMASDPTLLAAPTRAAYITAARAKLKAIAATAPPAVVDRLKRDPSLA